MNAQQRKYLIEKIRQKAKSEIHDLNRIAPIKPKLIEHIKAAALTGTLKIRKDIESHLTSLLQTVEETGSHSRIFIGDEDRSLIRFQDIFELPESYRTALRNYEAAKQTWDQDYKQVQETADTLEMKIQLSSSKVLESIIHEVDTVLPKLSILNESMTVKSKLLAAAENDSQPQKRLK